MKRTRKLILALVVVMSLLMAMAVAIIPASAVNDNYKVIYMKPGVWNTDNAWFAVWSYSTSSNGQWAKFTDYDGDGVYSAYIPVGHTKMNLVRMNSSAITPNWNQKWNQTSDIIINSNNYFTITGWSESNYSRGTHTVASKNVCFPGAYNNWDSNTKATVSNGIATMTVKITNATTYAFKVLVGDKWYSNSGTINGSTADNGWEMSTSVSGDCNLKITETGYYSFEFHLGTGYLSVHKHTGGTATCTEKAVCTVCGEKYGEALGHDWDDATCTAPKTCSVCGATEGEALGHDWNDATCTDPKTCGTCGATEGGPVHATVTHVASKAATCTENGNIEYWYCEACGQAWLDEDCRFNTNLLAVVLPMTNHLENCPHTALIGNKGYATIQDAIAGATAGSEIVLNSDIEVVGDLSIEKKVTINLNGKTLTAGAVVTFFEGTQFIGEGKLVVAQDSLYSIKGETDYVPVWNEAGYYTFSEVKDQIKESTVEGTEVVVFRPAFENKEIKKEFVDGAGDNGLSFVIRITWEGLAKPKEYTLTDDFIANVYNAEKPKAIQLGFENWQAGVEYTVTLRIVSGGIYYETILCTMKDGAITVPEIVTE